MRRTPYSEQQATAILLAAAMVLSFTPVLEQERVSLTPVGRPARVAGVAAEREREAVAAWLACLSEAAKALSGRHLLPHAAAVQWARRWQPQSLNGPRPSPQADLDRTPAPRLLLAGGLINLPPPAAIA